MDRKTWIYVGLLVVIVALMGVGIWAVLTPNNVVEIPETAPIVQMDVNNPAGGTLSQLSIYEDGTVIHVVDTAEMLPLVTGDEFTRAWRTGKAKATDIDCLFSYLESVDFNDITTSFVSEVATVKYVSGTPEDRRIHNYHVVPGGQVDYIRISAENGQTSNVVVAIGYLIPGDDPCADLPCPLNFIYEDLAEIIENNTEVALTEELTK